MEKFEKNQKAESTLLTSIGKPRKPWGLKTTKPSSTVSITNTVRLHFGSKKGLNFSINPRKLEILHVFFEPKPN